MHFYGETACSYIKTQEHDGRLKHDLSWIQTAQYVELIKVVILQWMAVMTANVTMLMCLPNDTPGFAKGWDFQGQMTLLSLFNMDAQTFQ